MKARLAIFFLCIALAVGGLAAAGRTVYAGGESVEVTETVLYGDPAYGAGTTLSGTYTWNGQLFWDISYTLGDLENAQSSFAFSAQGRSIQPNGSVRQEETVSLPEAVAAGAVRRLVQDGLLLCYQADGQLILLTQEDEGWEIALAVALPEEWQEEDGSLWDWDTILQGENCVLADWDGTQLTLAATLSDALSQPQAGWVLLGAFDQSGMEYLGLYRTSLGALVSNETEESFGAVVPVDCYDRPDQCQMTLTKTE